MSVLNPVIEHITPEMVERTESKFKHWDEIMNKNILDEGTEDEKRRAYRLLKDPTIYAYAHFKDMNDLSKPFRAYPYQDLFMNDNSDRVFFCAANQIGKSVALCLKFLHKAIMNPGHTYLLGSNTLPQSKDLLRQIRYLLTTSDLISQYDIGDSETKTEIYLKHFEEYEEKDENTEEIITKLRELPQSRLICVPATSAAAGYAAHGFGLDEIAFCDNGDWFYKMIAQPRTYSTKGFINIITNPNGQQGIAWELWNDPRFKRYRFNFLDCPKNTRKEYDNLCGGLSQEEIDSTLNAVFTNPAGGWLTLQEREKIQVDRPNQIPLNITEPVYIFFDWGKAMDRTVRAIGIPIKDGDLTGVHIYELYEYPHKTPYNVIINDLQMVLQRIGLNNVALTGWDNTGVGKGLEDFISRVREMGIQCCPVEFGLQDKARFYTILKLLIERTVKGQIGITIPKIKECDNQLAKLVFQRTSRGYLQVHHEKESDRDDYPDAIAGLCSLIIQPDHPPVSATVVNQGEYKGIADLSRCPKCQNYLDPGDEICSACGKNVLEVGTNEQKG